MATPPPGHRRARPQGVPWPPGGGVTIDQALAAIRRSPGYRAEFDESGAARDGGASALSEAEALRAAAVRAAREGKLPQGPPPYDREGGRNPPGNHPYGVRRQELAVTVARAAGLGEVVIVHPRPSTPIEITMVQKWVARHMAPPDTMVLVVETPRLDTVPRLIERHAQLRASGHPNIPTIILITPAAPDALEGVMGLRPGAIPVVETTPATVAEVVRERPAISTVRPAIERHL